MSVMRHLRGYICFTPKMQNTAGSLKAPLPEVTTLSELPRLETPTVTITCNYVCVLPFRGAV